MLDLTLNMPTLIILAVIVVLAVLAVRRIARKGLCDCGGHDGECEGGCAGCPHKGGCSTCATAEKLVTKFDLSCNPNRSN